MMYPQQVCRQHQLSGTVDITERRNAIQRDLDKPEKWAHMNLMRFNKYKVLHLGRDNPRHEYRLGEELIERSPAEKDSGVLVHKRLNTSQQCDLTEVQLHPGWHQQRNGQQVQGGDCPPLL